ncbi:MAG: NACHT domain-containing protein [Cyanobacteria bacterium P01_A01_bin.123]
MPLLEHPFHGDADKDNWFGGFTNHSGSSGRVEIHQHYGLPNTKPDAIHRDKKEKILIDAVWTEVEDRLRQSLHNAILIRLDMAEQRNQVSRPWDSQLRTAEQGIKPLEPGTHIADVFDRRDVGGKLLILGNPGSGKTTTMLDLAAVLIQRANAQPDQPIPVMFNLSSWQNAKQSITDWLLGELKLKYGVSPKLGQTWLAEKKLLPLLDGLDELPPQRQEPVVQAINDWLQSGEGPTRLLVCSRIEEYGLYGAKLALNGAICLELLTDIQLQDYLNSLRMGDLWQTLQQDTALLGLVRTPLVLCVSVLTHEAIDPDQWRRKQTTTERTGYLLDAYVKRQLHKAVKRERNLSVKQFTAKQIRRQLTWLARRLIAISSDEFSIEEIQSDFLNKRRKRVYKMVVSLGFGIIIGCIYWLLCRIIYTLVIESDYLVAYIENLVSTSFPSFPSFRHNQIFDSYIKGFDFAFHRGALWGMIISMLCGAFLGFNESRRNIMFTEAFSFQGINRKTLKIWLIASLALGLGFGLICLATFGINILYSPRFYIYSETIDSQALGPAGSIEPIFLKGSFPYKMGVIYLLFTAISWIKFWILFGIFKGIKKPIEVKYFSSQGILNNFRMAALYSFFICILITFFSFICLSFISNVGNVVHIVWITMPIIFLCAVLMSLASLGLPLIQHFVLRFLLCKSEGIPWNYTCFLNHCTERLILQRVGGRYRFIHKLIQEHFAAMPMGRE